MTHAANTDAFAKEDAVKQAKLDTLFGLILEHVVDLTELKISPAQLAGTACRPHGTSEGQADVDGGGIQALWAETGCSLSRITALASLLCCQGR